MTRRELAEFLRQHANTLQLPLVDGTDLSRTEEHLINSAMAKLTDVANLVEMNRECDANALRGLGIEAND